MEHLEGLEKIKSIDLSINLDMNRDGREEKWLLPWTEDGWFLA